MKRRDFLHTALSSFLLPVVIDGYGAKAFTRESAFIKALSQLASANDHVLVLVQLNGGNDGLNMVIPLNQMSVYHSIRKNIAIPENKVLKLNKYEGTGLHPAMTGMQQLFNEGKLSVVHSVSYPSPNFSHFRSNDIWFTASDSDKTLTSGWTGRYLDQVFPQYPDGYPNDIMPDPLAIQIGALASTALLGPDQSMALAIQDPDTFARLVGDKPNVAPDDLPPTYAGKNIGFIRQQQASSVQYAGQLTKAATNGKNQITYPDNNLADQLKIVARLIHGGLKTRVYYVTLGGFDTHSGQVEATDTTTGEHADLLKTLSDAISSFQTDLEKMGVAQRVVGMTFSEFGRRAVSNNSFGTDHGVAAPLFVFGSAVRTQMIGTNPNLSDLDKNNIKMQHDFRQVYATILNDWMGNSQAETDLLLYQNFKTLPIFNGDAPVTQVKPVQVYPTPADTELFIALDMPASQVKSLRLLNQAGKAFSVTPATVGGNLLRLPASHLPAGTYMVQLETASGKRTSKVVVVH